MYGQDLVHLNTAGDKSKMNKNPMPKQKVTTFATSDSKRANVQTQTSNKSEKDTLKIENNTAINAKMNIS